MGNYYKNHKKTPLLLFIVLFATLFISFISATSIPYEGMTLKWEGTSTFKNHDAPSVNTKEDIEITHTYSEIQDETINRKHVEENEESVIDIKTREIVGGHAKGNKTSHWIDTPVDIGDKIEINGDEYSVKGTSDQIFLDDFGKKEAIKVEYSENPEDIEVSETEREEDIEYKYTIWYDKDTGLKLKGRYELSYTHFFDYGDYGYDSYSKEEINEYQLSETGEDNDNDDFTDLEELLDYKTNPLEKDTDNDGLEDKEEINEYDTNATNNDTDNDGLLDGEEINEYETDPLENDTDGDGIIDGEEIKRGLNPNNKNTDGDWWNDAEDPAPTSAVVPLIYFILGILIIGGIIGWFSFKQLKKRPHKKNKKSKKE